MMLWVRLLPALTLVGAVFVTACVKSPQAKAEEAARVAASWEATVRLLDEQQARGALPEAFVRQVRRVAADAHEEATAQRRAGGAP